MFRFIGRMAYKRMPVEDLVRQLAQVRLVTVSTFGGVSGPSQLNKLAEQMVQEHWDWSRSSKDPIATSVTLTALAHAVEVEANGLALHMRGADIADVIMVSLGIWDLLEQRGLIDAGKLDEEMPPRLREHVEGIESMIQSGADEVMRGLNSSKGE